MVPLPALLLFCLHLVLAYGFHRNAFRCMYVSSSTRSTDSPFVFDPSLMRLVGSMLVGERRRGLLASSRSGVGADWANNNVPGKFGGAKGLSVKGLLDFMLVSVAVSVVSEGSSEEAPCEGGCSDATEAPLPTLIAVVTDVLPEVMRRRT